MRAFTRPKIVVSKCLGFEACRHNGAQINEEIMPMLEKYVDFFPVCPEVEIGLGTPREAIRLVANGDEDQLIQPKSNRDLTTAMNQFADRFLTEIEEIDGFILKNRSPSCGVTDAKVYSGVEKAPVVRTGSGTFTKKVVKFFPDTALEDEGRLKNFMIREHFLTRIFTMAEFRMIKKDSSSSKLMDFHARNKYLFMACHQDTMRELGRITANHKKKPMTDVFEQYDQGLRELFARPVLVGDHINVCQHVFGYFSKYLTSAEKKHFLHMLDQLREKKMPLSSILGVLRSWCYRFENKYLLQQSYFEPYPEGLVAISDSGKGRELS